MNSVELNYVYDRDMRITITIEKDVGNVGILVVRHHVGTTIVVAPSVVGDKLKELTGWSAQTRIAIQQAVFYSIEAM